MRRQLFIRNASEGGGRRDEQSETGVVSAGVGNLEPDGGVLYFPTELNSRRRWRGMRGED